MVLAKDSNFATSYMELCRQQRVRPLPMICVTLPHSLDFTTDRVKMDDWTPILNSLSLDRSLRSISVRSKYQHRKQHLDHANSESKARAVGKAPVVLTRYLLEWLSHSMAQCVRNSSVLTSLELEGIPLPVDCLAVLCLGLGVTKSLQNLSLQRCYIGDSGCELVCRAIAEAQSIRTLSLAQCDLGQASATALASALSKQKLALYHDAWKQSLRYREPKFEAMPGLRRLTLNGNAKLGNDAILNIIEAIRDSLWFKALDLQQCGLTNDIVAEIIQLLEHNETLAIVDVRLNPGVREDSLNEIARRLERNELRCKSEYRWMTLPSKKYNGRQQQRVSSAGNLREQKSEDNNRAPANKLALARPKSAIFRQVKRPPPPMLHRKPLLVPLPTLVKRIKTKPMLPAVERRPRQPMKPTERMQATQPAVVEKTPKISLHLDLQSQLKPLSASMENLDQPGTAEKSATNIETQPEPNPEPNIEANRLQEVMRELLETKEKRDKLAEDLRRTELALAEERARREFAESKLRSAKAELEKSTERRERDSRGYLLVSPQSMDEICRSFSRLLNMLESSSSASNKPGGRESDSEDEVSDIKRRFDRIIRKTKSENVKCGYGYLDGERLLSVRYGRSEADIRATSIEPLPSAGSTFRRMERNLGDTGERLPRIGSVSEEYWEPRTSTRMMAGGDDASPRDRARALFISLLNGDALLGMNTRMR